MTKFHFTMETLLWLAQFLSGLSRTEIPSVMPKATESLKVADIKSELLELPAFTQSGMIEPTSAIIQSMCKTVVTQADRLAGLEDDAPQAAINLVSHVARGFWVAEEVP